MRQRRRRCARHQRVRHQQRRLHRLTTCANAPGSFACGACPAGYTGTGLTGCVDINECATNNGGCSAQATCTNTPGSRTCACTTGFTGDGVTCTDVNECLTNNGGCDALTACTNTPGSRTCACPSGFTGTGLACADINECATNNGGCDPLRGLHQHARQPHLRACTTGYTGTGDTACVNINECATANGGCDLLTTCTDTPGSRTCGDCPAGYTGTGLTGCVETDECAANTDGCDPLTACTNTPPGSFTCSPCPSGYTGSGLSGCVETDECAADTDGCDPLTACTNTPAGSFTCSPCPANYTGTGLTGCVDLDECLEDNGGCDPFVRCQNNLGQPRTCGACPDGFTGTGDTTCTETAPLALGATETGGSTQAEMDAVLANWNPTLPPDKNELVPVPGVAVTTTAQANDVVVTPEALKFSLAAHPEVLEWEPGRIITSLPGDRAGGGYNPFGFMRKVAAVQVVGDEVTITTSIPALEEVVSGELQMEFDATTARVVEWDEFDHAWAADHLYVDVGIVGDHFPERLTNDESPPDRDSNGDLIDGDPGFFSDLGNAISDAWESIVPNSFSGDLRLDHEINLGAKTGVLNYDFTKTWDDISARFGGTAEFDGNLKFNPRTSLFVRIPNPIGAHPEPFQIALDVDAYLDTKLNVDITLEAALTSSAGKAGSELEAAIQKGEEFARRTLTYFKVKSMGDPDAKPVGGWKKVLWISKPSTQWILAGPVPVVFTETFQLDVECGFEVKASLKAKIRNQTNRTFKFRAAYEWGGGGSVEGPSYVSETQRSITVEGGGEASLSCGLIPRVNAFVYDAVGINLGVRGSGVVKAKYESTCNADLVNVTQPKGLVTFGLYANVGIQFGGRLQLPGSSYAGKDGSDLGFDIGPYELWTKEWPIIERTWDVQGLGFCAPICRDVDFTADRETDIDCGDECPSGCALGKRCNVNRDCANGGYCIPGSGSRVCSDNHCLDGVVSGTESATDCGGSKCNAAGQRCALGRRCIENVDCQSGICAKGRAVAPDSDAGYCVDDPMPGQPGVAGRVRPRLRWGVRQVQDGRRLRRRQPVPERRQQWVFVRARHLRQPEDRRHRDRPRLRWWAPVQPLRAGQTLPRVGRLLGRGAGV